MKPARDRRYLAYIRRLPCLVCGTRQNIEAAHTGPHGLSQKAPDRQALPLCRRHHRTGNDSLHALGPRKFEIRHHLGLIAEVRRLNQKPVIRIEAGWFVAYLQDGREERIGEVDRMPMAKAIRAALVCREAVS